MKNKKIIVVLVGVGICIAIAFVIYNQFFKNKEEMPTEITPGEEITEEQERQTIISLYYINVETNILMPEARVIDAKNLLENPYKALMEYIIGSPKNEKLKSAMPEGTKVNNANFNGGIVTVDLSKEFIEKQNEETLKFAVYAIVNTLTELNEVNSVKILIEGEEQDKEIEENINLKNNIMRKE